MKTAHAPKILAFVGMVGSASIVLSEAAAETVKPGMAHPPALQLTQMPAGAQGKAQNSTKPASDAQGRFIFHAQDVQHSTNPNLTIRLGEKIAPQALKKRFSGYSVRYAKGEGCLTCAAISGPDGRFQIDFDQDGRTVNTVRSTDDRSRDAKGSQVGSLLGVALGSNRGNCDAGETTICASPDFKGLSYIVAEDERCPITVNEQQLTEIPACALIAGFEITAVGFGR